MVAAAPITVLITGASRGIGYATARAFVARGARVAFCARDAARLADSERQLSALGEVLAQVVDVRSLEQVTELVAMTRARLGDIDVAVNNAGVLWSGPFAKQDADSMSELIDVNVKGVLHATRAVIPDMLSRKRGVVINVASGAGLNGFADLAVYCASKFAVVGFSESLDLEVREQGVRVFALCPGSTQTDMLRQYARAARGMPPESVADRILEIAYSPSRYRASCITVP